MSEASEAWGGGLWAAADLVTPMTIRVAATLRLADEIVAGRVTVSSLADQVGADPDALDRVLRHLVTVGLLTRSDDGTYGPTASGEYMRDDNPDGVRGWIDLHGAVGRADLSLVQLLHTVTTGEAAFPKQFGLPFWDDLAADEHRAASFDALMGAQLVAQAPTLAGAYNWGALGHVVDVGGGNATLLIALLQAHPKLRGTVVDLAAPAARATAAIDSAGLAERADVVTGSFFDPLPAGAGGYIVSAILPDWGDTDARRILRRCREAAGPSGKVLVVDGIGTEHGHGDSTEMDIRMLAYFLGRQRNLEQLSALAADARLTVASITPTVHRSVIELTNSDGRQAPLSDRLARL